MSSGRVEGIKSAILRTSINQSPKRSVEVIHKTLKEIREKNILTESEYLSLVNDDKFWSDLIKRMGEAEVSGSKDSGSIGIIFLVSIALIGYGLILFFEACGRL